jgi:hypothetical protein
MTFTPEDIRTMRQALIDLQDQIMDLGPCDHPVDVCICGLRTTHENLADLFHRMTDGEVGFAKQPVPTNPEFDMVSFARTLVTHNVVQQAAQLKAETDARNAQFKKGTING